MKLEFDPNPATRSPTGFDGKPATAALAGGLRALLGADHVLDRPAELAGWSADIFRRGVLAECVISPGTVEEAAAAVKLCTDAGRAVIPIGGGFSYTGGYLATRPSSVLVNLRRLDRIVEINDRDLYVTVEAGMTWKALYDALQPRGLRTPFFGPMSGFASTVGGALSQGSFFLGSTQYGTAAESTLGLDLVLADGSRLRTGSAATPYEPSPFFRTYGPDLTGIFLGDTGALGLKLRATLKLIPDPNLHRYASFAFDDPGAVLEVLADIARRGLAAEAYGWDPYMVESFAKRSVELREGLEYLRGVVKSAASTWSGVRDAARVAVAGHRFAKGAGHLVHATVDETLEPAAAAKIAAIEEICRRAGGVATEPSVPRALRGVPFTYPNRLLGAKGERWVPTHALAPHSRAPAVLQAFRDYMAARQDIVDRFGFEYGVIFFAVGSNTMCIEPLFWWPDARLASHERLLKPEVLDAVPRMPEMPASGEAMANLRAGLAELFMHQGCVHAQIGKFYRYKDGRDPATFALLQSIKSALDPRNLMNPGSLGL
jgi:FAD/FMN-containing dehydrogenase